MTAFNVIKSLTKRGNNILGYGSYSAVFSNRSDAESVIKISSTASDKWVQYYNLIINTDQFKHNPYVPRVSSFYYDEEHDYYIAEVERLSSFCEFSLHKKYDLLEAIESFLNNITNTETLIRDLQEFPTVVKNTTAMACLLKALQRYQWEDDTIQLDMHDNNVMFRSDGTIVITDPWCNNDLNYHKDMSDWYDAYSSGDKTTNPFDY